MNTVIATFAVILCALPTQAVSTTCHVQARVLSIRAKIYTSMHAVCLSLGMRVHGHNVATHA